MESKVVDPKADEEAAKDVLEQSTNGAADQDSAEDVEFPDYKDTDAVAAGSAAKKKRSKKAKMKQVLGVGKKEAEDKETSGSSSNLGSKVTSGMVEQLLEMNPSLKGEVAGMDKEKAAQALKKLDVADLLTGMSVSGKNQKDMASYKFWQTQPVPRFDEAQKEEEGQIKDIDPEKVPKEPPPMLEGFEWVTMNLLDEQELEEVYNLLTGHYVEDDEAMFRFNYSSSFLNWALKSPGWRKEWHVGVRATKSRRLVAFISGVPVSLRVRSNVFKSTEVNFLCIHKKLRSKRLAPVLIQEITRRSYVLGIFQGLYTGGIVLPKPVSSCRYFHRSLDWLKLYEVGFSPLPSNSTKARQITRYHLPSSTSTPGLRPMQKTDVDAVLNLLGRFLKRFTMAPVFDREEVEHWLLHDDIAAEQVIWSYVVEDPSTHKITDFFSFYCLESSVIGNQKHDNVRAAYLFYYATEMAFADEEKGLKERMTMLMTDALILAKKARIFNFDVFNALTLLDNPLFLESLKFGPGDGQLHYYLYNYRTAPIAGGVDAKNNVDASRRGGIGVVMLNTSPDFPDASQHGMMAGTKRPRTDDLVADPASPTSSFMTMFEVFRSELDEHHDRRERIVKASRDITASSKKMIFSLQRVHQLRASIPPAVSKEISFYQIKITELFTSVASDLQDLNAWRYQSQISPGIQEYVEAISFQHYLETQRLISYQEAQAKIPGGITLTEDDYVLGLFDLVGELMRFAITSMATHGAVPRGAAAKEGGEGGDIMTDLRQLRASFEGLDGVGRKADRKMDVMRSCVEKVEGAVYGMIVRGRERPKGWVMDVGEERRGEVESY